ncbi:MAG: ThiF family adenylyltransferase, partial [Bacteroidetes bacterium]|nr:ThiF family adenylyltransferase [Bacteroidota bacterium]
VGLSVGHSAAVTIAMERSAGTIRIADFDDLELSNLNRIRAGVFELGLPKWLIAARTIAETDPYINVEVFPDGVKEENIERFMNQCDVVIDACDGLAAKAMIRIEALERKIPVIMDTSDRGMLDIERYDILNSTDGFLHGRIDSERMTLLRKRSHWDTETLNLFIDFSTASERGQMSLAKMGTDLVGWPQLYSDVASGSAFAAEAARRLLLGEDIPDSRLYLEIDEQLSVKN